MFENVTRDPAPIWRTGPAAIRDLILLGWLRDGERTDHQAVRDAFVRVDNPLALFCTALRICGQFLISRLRY